MDIFKLCDLIRQTAYDIHVYFGNGYLEKVYENALKHRLEKAGFKVEQQIPLIVKDEDGFMVGEYFADLLIGRILIIELKATKALTDEHSLQLLNYMIASHMKHGLLINFGSQKFECRKFIK